MTERLCGCGHGSIPRHSRPSASHVGQANRLAPAAPQPQPFSCGCGVGDVRDGSRHGRWPPLKVIGRQRSLTFGRTWGWRCGVWGSCAGGVGHEVAHRGRVHTDRYLASAAGRCVQHPGGQRQRHAGIPRPKRHLGTNPSILRHGAAGAPMAMAVSVRMAPLPAALRSTL
jgi:hypothetical protein